MPAKDLPDTNIMFLYLCIKHSDAKINYEAVGEAMGLKVPAARMRFTRLKEKIESGMTPEDLAKGSGGGGEADEGDGGAAATPSPTKKRKVAKERTPKGKGKGKGKGNSAQGDDNDVEGEVEGEFMNVKEETSEV
ncbi:uncharacterized protein BDV14DRAFT_197184 [Aspergillus stella-maris]|uniref:uncharacterized protein n=1 Tax=Aspergillus stella-maris TaxID=1810926 RepID=UPI003CCD05AE